MKSAIIIGSFILLILIIKVMVHLYYKARGRSENYNTLKNKSK